MGRVGASGAADRWLGAVILACLTTLISGPALGGVSPELESRGSLGNSVNFPGRVAGLSVTITSGPELINGVDVAFDVEMITKRRTSGRETEDGFSFATTTTSTSGAGGLGDLFGVSQRRYTGSFQFSVFLSGFSNSYYYNSSLVERTWYDPDAGTLVGRTWNQEMTVEGELPAIDFGDGNAVERTSLSFVSRTTATNLSVRGDTNYYTTRWRGSFSHSYVEPGEYEIVVASRCCARQPSVANVNLDSKTSPNVSTGTVVFPQSPSQLQLRSVQQDLTVFRNAVVNEAETFTPGGSPRYGGGGRGLPFTTSGTFSGTRVIATTLTASRTRAVNQVVSRASVRGSVLAIPTASSMGLSLLAGLLFLAAVRLLRSV